MASHAASNYHVHNPAKHLFITWSPEDAHRLTDSVMTEYCLEYLRRMGYTNTQTLIYRHLDKSHPHAHVVLNRVDYDSNVLKEPHSRSLRSQEVAFQMNKEYGFSRGKDRSFVPLEKSIDLSTLAIEYVKLDMKNDIAYAMSQVSSIDKLPEQLLVGATGISVRFHYADDGITRNGISFSKVYTDECGRKRAFALSGSQIEPAMAIGGLK